MKDEQSLRNIKDIIAPLITSDGAGVKLGRLIGTRHLDHLDPFLLLDHFGSENPDDYIAGFPMHPHRGIETVTYMLSGAVMHKDSIGNEGVIESGDIQWMTAGGGIMHEEMPQLREGKMDGFQLWVNMPARLKMSSPRYQEMSASDIPKIEEDGVTVKIIAGNFKGVQGAVEDIYVEPSYLDVQLDPGTAFDYQIPPDHNVFAYLFEGDVIYGSQQTIKAPNLIIFDLGNVLQFEAGREGGRFILVSGKPLNEPIARYGPFVMNTQTEIIQTLNDIQNGTFIKP